MAHPHYGPRDQFSVRPSKTVGERVREDARREGRPQGDMIARILADHYGLPYYDIADYAPVAGQEELPMTG